MEATPFIEISRRELVELYGERAIDICDAFNIDSVFSPYCYLLFANSLAFHYAVSNKEDMYLNVLERFNKDIYRYDQYLEITEALAFKMDNLSMFNQLKTPLRSSDFIIKNQKNILNRNEFKNESDLENIIFKSLTDFDYEYNYVIKKQVKLDNGIADLLMETEDRLTFIELKKSTAKRKDIYQTYDYSFGHKKEVDLILIASEFPKDVIELAEKLKVNCFIYKGHIQLPDIMVDLVKVSGGKTNLDFVEENYQDFGFSLFNRHPYFNVELSKYFSDEFKKFKKQSDYILNISKKFMETDEFKAIQRGLK